MKPDAKLIHDVRRKITGANIHKLGALLCLYDGAIACYNKNSTKSEFKQAYWKKEAEKYKKQLEGVI